MLERTLRRITRVPCSLEPGRCMAGLPAKRNKKELAVHLSSLQDSHSYFLLIERCICGLNCGDPGAWVGRRGVRVHARTECQCGVTFQFGLRFF